MAAQLRRTERHPHALPARRARRWRAANDNLPPGGGRAADLLGRFSLYLLALGSLSAFGYLLIALFAGRLAL